VKAIAATHSGRGALALCLAWTLLGGCGAGEEAAPSAQSPPVGESVAFPDPGGVHVAVEGSQITLLANDAPPERILTILAERAGFELSLEVNLLEPEARTLRVEDVKLEELLPLLLRGAAYQLEYRFDPATGNHAVAHVATGRPGLGNALDRKRGREARLRREEEWSRRNGGRAAAASARSELATLLQSSDERVRLDAVFEMRASGEELEWLLDALYDDPSGRVRAAAASQLVDAKGFAVMTALVDALEDREPGVVLVALEVLVASGDRSLGAIFEELAEDHPDESVRDAAESALEQLE